ncbi:MAG: carboxymuconolactone decarboxylase family protein [Dehalococcoidia bacterium]|nr:carboxymuconolactone decarboxylase family protein [Dehalococcoidia bacterium]MCA9825986.1 carboxymuconolactone decarboxylase family protein [Dehalococcoidia bacterium]MCA9843369.1 carboxymuconolactone decarboxylase family protein [Dehalococcoidia bacterium]
MPRLREVPRAEAPPEALPAYDRMFGDRDPVAEPGTATGTPGNWWTVFAQSPEILTYFQQGGALYKSPNRVIPPYYVELGILRTGFAVGSKFVFSQHAKGARAAGISKEKVAAVPHWAVTDLFDEAERAVLGYVDEMVLSLGRVQDGTFAVLKKHFKDEAILELTYIVGLYMMYAVLTKSLRLEYDDVDERVVEVPVPGSEGAGDVDIMSMMSGDNDKG